MKIINEYTNVEKPIMDFLRDLGWEYLSPEEVSRLRENDETKVYFETIIKEKIKELNDVNNEQLNQIIREIKKIRKNEEFQEWIQNKKSIKLKGNKTSTRIKIINYKNTEENIFQFTTQFRVRSDFINNKPDLVLFVNGFPIIVIEAKAPNVGIEQGINQVQRYTREMPELFKYNQFNIVADGQKLKYASTGSPSRFFFEWRHIPKEFENIPERYEMKRALYGLLNKKVLLDVIRNFITYSKEGNKNIKMICRFQQYIAANKVYDRVLEGKYKQGLIWHTQGSGKTMTMFFTASKIKRSNQMNNPTVLMIADRVDLGEQTQGVFESVGLGNVVKINSILELKERIEKDSREILVTTVQKFNDRRLKNVTTNRENIIILIDEGHRSQEGDFGSTLRKVFPNAFLFSYTGTPVQKGNRDTFKTFGIIKDNKITEKYMHKYSNVDGVRDGVVLPVIYNFRYQSAMLTKSEMDSKYMDLTDGMTEEEREQLDKELLKPENIDSLRKRISKIVKDLEKHYREKIEPSGFKAQIVAPNRVACAIYKEELDKIINTDESEVIMSSDHNDDPFLKRFKKNKFETKNITDKFKKENKNPKLLIVTDMLLTGFDAPIEKVMYLDKKLKDHTLLQAVARTNRPAKNKGHGLVVDYSGVLTNLTKALNFSENDIKCTLQDIEVLKKDFDLILARLKKAIEGYDLETNEGLIDAISKIRFLEDVKKEQFNEDFNELKTIYETLSPDPFLIDNDRNIEYKNLTKIYLAVKKEETAGSFDIEDLGTKTKELLENVHFGSPKNNNRYFYLDQIKKGIFKESKGDVLVDQRFEKAIIIDSFIKDHKDNPYIGSIAERLEEKIKQRMEKVKVTEEMILELIQTSNEGETLNELRELKEENNLTDRGLLLFTILSNNLKYPTDFIISLSKRLDSYLDEVLFKGWSSKISLEKDLALKFLEIIRLELKEIDLVKMNETIEILIKTLKEVDKNGNSRAW